MTPRILIFSIACLGVLWGASYFLVPGLAGRAVETMPSEVDLEVGSTLYTEFCAACHGENLEGQTNWQTPGEDGRLPAPPHDATGHTWHHADQVLFEYTKLGGKTLLASQGVEFDSGMPGFADQLTDKEIWNILGFIRSTWPERVQKAQEGRTVSETKIRNN